MPTQGSPGPLAFPALGARRVVAGFDGGRITSDAGALLLGATDRAIRLVERVAACFTDGRRPDLIEHDVATLVGQRIVGLALGYEDLDDHDLLRHDPVPAGLAGKLEPGRARCAPLAGKSTLNRLERPTPEASRCHMTTCRTDAIERLFIDVFVAAHHQAPKQLVLDLDATDDPLHGQQGGRFSHGHHKSYCCLPLYIFCGRHLLVAKLRRSNQDAAAGACGEVARVVGEIRSRWPKTRILLRADSGFARDELMTWCEADGVGFLFGLAKNAPLIDAIADRRSPCAGASERCGLPNAPVHHRGRAPPCRRRTQVPSSLR